jgi:hypothetical protein
MALKKSFENSHGITFEYWRVMPDIHVDFATKEAHASLLVWVTQAARIADKQPLHFHEVMTQEQRGSVKTALILSGEDFTTALATGDLRTAIYTRIKALDVFAGAEDILEDPQ